MPSNSCTARLFSQHQPFRVVLAVFAMLLLAACAPDKAPARLESIQSTKAVDLRLILPQENNHNSTPPVARLFNKYNLAEFYPVSIEPDKSTSSAYLISAELMNKGSYRLVIDIPVQRHFAGIPFGSTNITLLRDFTIHPKLRPACFRFDNKQKSVMGWKSTHVYQGNQEQPASRPSCPGLFYINSSWPTPPGQSTPTSEQGGSLFIPVSSECFPKTSNKLSEQPGWMFSIISPDLLDNTDWNNINAIEFRVAGKELSFKVSPEIHFRIGDKLSSTFEQNDRREVYEVQSNLWQIIEHKINLPPQAQVTHIEFHISGVPEQTVDEGVNSIFFDGICPVHP